MEKSRNLLRHCKSTINCEDTVCDPVAVCEEKCDKKEHDDNHLYNGYGFDITAIDHLADSIDHLADSTVDLKRPRLIMNKAGKAVIKVKMVNKKTKKDEVFEDFDKTILNEYLNDDHI